MLGACKTRAMADEGTKELAALRAELASLRERVEGLDRELRRAHGHVDLTMRGQVRCRACGCRRIANVPSVLDRDEGGDEHLALFKPKWWSSKAAGEMEVYVCTKCGAVEWWVKDPGSLEPHEEFLQILDGETPDQGPFR